MEVDWINFKQVKNRVTNLIKETKKTYFKNKVTENKQNPRKLWNLIKCLSKDDDRHESGVERLIEDDVVITDKKDIAETLNSFFVNQQNKLMSALGLNAKPMSRCDFYITPGAGEFSIPHITKQKVANLLLSIPVHKATGDDGISAKLLRIAAPALIDSLSRLLNHCIDTGSFPGKWKVQKKRQ